MPTYSQTAQPLSLTTPLGPDVLLLIEINGREAISELFHFQLGLMAENDTNVSFDKLLGQKVTATIRMAGKEVRYISGIVSRISQSGRDQTFTSYRMEVVPQFWLLTRIRQSRIFQQLPVPDILKKVLTGMDVTYELKGDDYKARDYCVQYRESDFAFASRLMEEEGIYYFFKHTAGGHKLVLADTPNSHPDLDPATIIYEEIKGGNRPEERIDRWERSQELRSGKTTLWDHCFEMAHKHLEATKAIADSVPVGTVTHKLKVGNNDKLELYDWPGDYASRFDGVDPGGAERPADVQKIFQDNTRTVGIRMQAEATQGITIRGSSSCPFFTPGHSFTLDRHFNANGKYVLTGVEHSAKLDVYRSAKTETDPFVYDNNFTCIPFALPYRPPRVTALPQVAGTQTAVVVGPAGQEIFTDKYGRIKVQFHWDRDGKNDGKSSCWLRVATPWAGKNWGMIHIPRIGQEVIVDFINGNPNDPICIGSVYNAEMMPPYDLPENKTQSGFKSRSSLTGSTEHFNEISFEDKKDNELLYIRAQKDCTLAVEYDDCLWVGNDRKKTIHKNEETWIEEGNRTEIIEKGNENLTIKMGNREEKIEMGNDKLTIDMGNSDTKLGMGNMTMKMDLGKSETEAMQSIELIVGQSSIKVDQTGVTIKGMMITIEGQVTADMKSPMTTVKGDAMLTLKGGLTMIN